jgi:hypothetical protein
MMEQNIKYTKYLGVKVFSNKWYSIHVMLFNQGMARVGTQKLSLGNEFDMNVMLLRYYSFSKILRNL